MALASCPTSIGRLWSWQPYSAQLTDLCQDEGTHALMYQVSCCLEHLPFFGCE